MSAALSYVIKFVANMDTAVAFYAEQLGFKLRFQSPHWSEFETGGTTLALHPASSENPAGSCQLGFKVNDLQHFYSEKSRAGVVFTQSPTSLHGQRIARMKDSEGAECSVSG